MESDNKLTPSWLDHPLASFLPQINIEALLIAIILLAAVVSRFYNLGARVMSHDEVNHVVPSFDLYQGRGYRHDPVTHGPLQFHLIALTYFIFGDNDFTSRTPQAIFSVVTIAVVIFTMRRYIGRTGALIAGVLFLISPYMLFYGRYARNEAFVALWGVLTIYGVLRYLEKGDQFSLYLLVAVTALHFCTKETSYIYTAILLLSLAIIFLKKILEANWWDTTSRNRFIVLVIVALLLLGVTFATAVVNSKTTQAAAQATPPQASGISPQMVVEIIALVLMLVSAGLALFVLVRAQGWEMIRSQRSFDLLMLVGTLIIPLGTAIPVKLVGWDPLDYSTNGIIHTSIFLVIMVAIAVAIGLWWKPRLWLYNAALFYGIFTVLYTTFFTNGQGFFTGLVGSLGYWMSQQGVERGSQPIYYFALIQIPVYEYLGALGTLLAFYFGLRHNRFETVPSETPASQEEENETIISINGISQEKDTSEITVLKPQKLPILALLLFWSLTSLIAYSVAGEKMPWITVHIALPLLLSAGWGLGYLVDTIAWKKLLNTHGLVVLLLLPVFLTSLGGVFGVLMGNTPPFQGNTLEQLQATSTFVLALATSIASGWGILRLLQSWRFIHIAQLLTATIFAILAVLTARTAIMASFINYDNAKEYLVYAHGAPGSKEILAQVEEISRRTTGGLDIAVAYDDDALYPYWWYLRNYPKHNWYGKNPTRDLRDAPVIIAGESTMSKVDSIVKDTHVSFDYIRLWWPNQDYFNLTWDRIWGVIKDPQMRQAVFNIWLNRDYSLYAKLTNNSSLTLENWSPAARMKLYIRKDIIAQMWNYGSAPVLPKAEEVDPYLANSIQLKPDQVIGTTGNGNGQLQSPRGIAIGKDGSIYVADSKNNRIEEFSPNGDLITTWGTFADVSKEAAPGGTFNEPWGIAVGPDGNVYVADTWNHRIQKFTADGEFITLWNAVPGGNPEVMWGPRGIVVDDRGRVYVTDTGNKRILIFTSDGNLITQFGTGGMDPGQFDEPVGIALDDQGNIFIADTWNQRMQEMAPDLSGMKYLPVKQWDIHGWDSKSVDNKPFITINKSNIYVTDPEGYRVLVFSTDGNFVLGWGDYSSNTDGFGLPAAVAVDADGHVWVSDAANNHILRFTLPAK